MSMKVLVLDNNSEYFEHLVRFLEKRKIDYVVRKPLDDIRENYCCVIASGGCIPRKEKKRILEWYRSFLNSLDKPFLGICLGHKILGYIYGARILRSHEKGLVKVHFLREYPLAPNIRSLTVYQDHDFGLALLPNKIVNYARSDTCSVQAIKVLDRPHFGVQFHPEFGENDGYIILENFLRFSGVL